VPLRGKSAKMSIEFYGSTTLDESENIFTSAKKIAPLIKMDAILH
jgi:hypothetical protein